MRYLFLVLAMLACIQSQGQKIRFTDTTNMWRVLNSFSDGSGFTQFWNLSYSYKGSIVKNGQTYYILSGSSDSALVREDTVNRKVYALIYKNKYRGSDTVEFILYDFSLNVGDSFSNNMFTYKIISIDSTRIRGVFHKVYTYFETQRLNQFFVVEGIGAIKDPFIPYFASFFEEDNNLVCFSTNSNYPGLSKPVHNFDNAQSCKDTLLNISPLPGKTSRVSLYPQPAHKYVTISLPANTSGSIELYNTMGQKVFMQTFSNKQALEIRNDIWHGLYVYKITDITNNRTYKGKMVFH